MFSWFTIFFKWITGWFFIDPALQEEKIKIEKQKMTVMLHKAIRDNDKKVILKLMKSGADLNYPNEMGMNSLHVAVLFGAYDLIPFLIKLGVDTEQNCDASYAGFKPLHLVAFSRSKSECLEKLIECGVNIHSRDGMGNNILHLLLTYDPSNVQWIGKMLILEVDPSVINRNGNNCLHLLAKNTMTVLKFGELLTEMMILCGTNVNEQNELGGDTPLHIAVRQHKISVADALLQGGARIDIPNHNGTTAFDALQLPQNLTKSMCSIFLKHIILKKHSGEELDPKIIQTINSIDILKKYLEYYEHQLAVLQLKNVTSNKSITYYDILLQDEKKIAKYLRNESIRDELSKPVIRISTMYAKHITLKVKKAIKIFRFQEGVFEEFNKHLYDKLPPHVIMEIAECIKYEDFQDWEDNNTTE